MEIWYAFCFLSVNMSIALLHRASYIRSALCFGLS
uniref:Uncharacterized protein n=1 Tax=Arundo donax TaxID=35708 RepID=A0A0A9FP84_ARUDO